MRRFRGPLSNLTIGPVGSNYCTECTVLKHTILLSFENVCEMLSVSITFLVVFEFAVRVLALFTESIYESPSDYLFYL